MWVKVKAWRRSGPWKILFSRSLTEVEPRDDDQVLAKGSTNPIEDGVEFGVRFSGVGVCGSGGHWLSVGLTQEDILEWVKRGFGDQYVVVHVDQVRRANQHDEMDEDMETD
jgi:hypothetical protein